MGFVLLLCSFLVLLASHSFLTDDSGDGYYDAEGEDVGVLASDVQPLDQAIKQARHSLPNPHQEYGP